MSPLSPRTRRPPQSDRDDDHALDPGGATGQVDAGGTGVHRWEQPRPRIPLLHWRGAGAALVLVVVAVAAWWAVTWLTAPQAPPVPGDVAVTDAPPALGVAASTPPEPDTAGDQGSPPGADSVPTPTSEAASVLRVHVVGEVTAPGVVSLPAGARVADALAAAGGPSDRARPDRINLAAPVQDGQRILIPDATTPQEQLTAEGSTSSGPTPSGPATAGAGPAQSAGAGADGERVDLNRADSAELQTLPGVGPAMAERIIAHREQVGPFTGLQDLDAVSGVGPATLERLRDRVSW